MKKIISFSIVLIIVISCATNPITGRQSVQLISNSELFPSAFSQYTQVLGESKVVSGTKDATMIKTVGEKIKNSAQKLYTQLGLANQLQGYQWEFNLIDSKELNAWCMPGGKVAFYTGIIPVCKNDVGVAVVMGHEVAHALAGHGAERASHAMIAQGIALGGNIAISNNQWRNIFNQIYPIGSTVGLMAYSRKQELDADKAGLFLMAMAGYDPREAIPFWERMEAKSTGQARPPAFLSTHPDPEKRRADLNSYMPEALKYYTAATGKK